ncbi:hypothetical protein M409DRAFT_56416 [Zasmidium cellare ATCC 36951]|uniref:Uncharacterized protein n=1 Tax=Zasmidium cellare ATCC 36951 TaxID=1080233 RepID=A0A6A6CCW5_ZASCE|nr:uncharacterized protein M409DRAFT_56416 [Zasmidium cellare ATCC 36951]KAF2164583.1 hypothetical protein M409DRAFT_56416 [Zasmidium cellare ATCC 36951]
MALASAMHAVAWSVPLQSSRRDVAGEDGGGLASDATYFRSRERSAFSHPARVAALPRGVCRSYRRPCSDLKRRCMNGDIVVSMPGGVLEGAGVHQGGGKGGRTMVWTSGRWLCGEMREQKYELNDGWGRRRRVQSSVGTGGIWCQAWRHTRVGVVCVRRLACLPSNTRQQWNTDGRTAPHHDDVCR